MSQFSFVQLSRQFILTWLAIYHQMPLWLPFKGFIAQKEKCLYLYSDIGTTFVGVHHELRELRKLSALEAQQSNRLKFANSETLTWHFTPPHSPHFGGFGRLE